MKKILYLMFMGVMAVHIAAAQTLSGVITESEFNEPLPGATIYIPSLELGTAATTDGSYSLKLPREGVFRVVYQYIGYQSETRTVQVGMADVKVNVELRYTTLETAPITVTARSAASDVLSTPQPVHILGPLELQQNMGIVALEAIEGVQGVRLIRTGSGVAKPVIRGLTGQRILVVEDGVRQEGQQWGEEHGPELDGFSIEGIEVVKGPSSLLYGSDALGGVIQANSYDLFASTGKIQGKVGSAFSSNPALLGGYVRLSGRVGNWAYSSSVTRKAADAYRNPVQFVPNTALDETDATLSAGYQIKEFELSGQFKTFNSDLGLFEPDLLAEVDEFPRDAILTPFQRVQHRKATLTMQKRWNGNRISAQSSWQRNIRKEFEEEHAHDEALIPEEEHAEGEELHDEPALYLQLDSYTTDIRLHHRPFGRVFGSAGLSLFTQTNETLGEETLIPSANVVNLAAYIAEELLYPEFTLSGGLRLDHRSLDVTENEDLQVADQTRTYTAFSGALGAAWHPLSDISFSVNVGRAWRAPVLAELFGNGVHHGAIRFERGDPTLKVEQSLSLDGMFRWITPHVFFEASVYSTRISDFIHLENTGTLDPNSGFTIFQYTQSDALLRGAEFSLEWHPHPLDWLHLVVAGDRVRGENSVSSSPLPMMPADRIQLELALTKEKLGSFSNLEWHIGPTKAFRQKLTGENEAPSQGYWVWETMLGAEVRTNQAIIQPSIRVENVLNTEYFDHLSTYRRYGILNPGRNVRLQVVATF